MRYVRTGLAESCEAAVSQATDDRHQRVKIVQFPQPLHSRIQTQPVHYSTQPSGKLQAIYYNVGKN